MYDRAIAKVNRDNFAKLFKNNFILEEVKILDNILQYKSLPECDSIKLSKSQIKQYLLYHFLPLTSEGICEYILEYDLAEKLNINIKTVRRNNIILQATGFIKFHREDIGCISIKIENYQNAFEKGSSGTINIPHNVLDVINDFKEINTLKIFLILFSEHFSYLRNSKNISMTKQILVKKLKEIIPNGKNYDLFILRILDKLKEFFEITGVKKIVTKLRSIEYRTKEEFLTFIYERKHIEEATTIIVKAFKCKNLNKKLTANVFDDLYILSKEYGLELFKKALSNFNESYLEAELEIGAIVRREINSLL